jgi:2-oxoglutarate/2-oxoacid ferredoxin oxidoreductase subunit alpha
VGWGSTYGVMREAIDSLRGEADIAMLHFSELYPFPDGEKMDFMRILRDARLTVCIENNASGQFARLVRAETGYEFAARLNKYDGRPFLLDDILGGLHDHV